MREEKIARSVSGALIVLPVMFMPLYLIWGFAFARSVLLFGFGCTAVGIAAGWLLGRRHPALQIAASVLPSALLALAVPIHIPGADIVRYCLMGLGALHAVWTERRSVASGDTALKSGLLLAPLLALLFVSVFLWFTAKSTATMTADVWTLLLILGALWFAVAAFLLNRLSLRQAAHAGSHSDVPEGARRSGTAGVVLFIVATFVLAGISDIVQGLVAAFRAAAGWLIQAVLFLLNLLSKLFAPSAEGPQASGEQDMPLPPGGEASPLAQLISNILIALVLLAVVAAIVYGLAKLFPKLWQKIRDRLSGVFAGWREEEADYQDRAESLMSLKQALSGAGERLRKFARRFRRRPRLDDFPTNAGRIRFLFREYLRGLVAARREPPPGATATEIAKTAPALAGAYNRARYAGEEPGDGEVAKAQEQVER
jgi:hypothetical protein